MQIGYRDVSKVVKYDLSVYHLSKVVKYVCKMFYLWLCAWRTNVQVWLSVCVREFHSNCVPVCVREFGVAKSYKRVPSTGQNYISSWGLQLLQLFCLSCRKLQICVSAAICIPSGPQPSTTHFCLVEIGSLMIINSILWLFQSQFQQSRLVSHIKTYLFEFVVYLTWTVLINKHKM